MKKRVLVLFPNEWDRGEFARPKYADEYEFLYAGTEFFKFPGILSLLWFDAVGFADSLVRRHKNAGLAGVLSSDEYVGATIAADVARRLGLPATEPGRIVLAQHKYFSRRAQKQAIPEAVPSFSLVPIRYERGLPLDLPFPFFVKPVKGTFSLFAAKVDGPEALEKHLDFTALQRFLLRRVTRPFNDLIRAHTDFDRDANWFLGEELIEGVQVTLDGFVWDGDVRIMGVVDSVMFPDTNIFERFDYPSRMIPKPVQERMADIATRALRGIGFRQGQFNIELFWDAKRDALKIIEINPRLSYQFADLYENVDGSNTYDVLLDLALGRKPRFEQGSGKYAFAASFVLRTFEGKKLAAVPTRAQVDDFSRRYEEARVRVYGRKGQSLASEMRAIGSYRYGIVNVGANSLLDLFAIYADAREQLPFRFD